MKLQDAFVSEEHQNIWEFCPSRDQESESFHAFDRGNAAFLSNDFAGALK